MAQFIVRNRETAAKDGLGRRAERYGRNMDDEVGHIQRRADRQQNQPAASLGTRIAARFAKDGLTADPPDLRGQCARPADVGERSFSTPTCYQR